MLDKKIIYFLTVAEEGSFSAAAILCHVLGSDGFLFKNYFWRMCGRSAEQGIIGERTSKDN